MKADPLTFMLMLALISRNTPSVKDKKKQLIKLVKKSSGNHEAALNHILRNNEIDKNIWTMINDQREIIESINMYRAGGALGLITVGTTYHPIFIDVCCEEDKELALESERSIIRSALHQVKCYEYKAGTRAVAVLFAGDGFSGIPVEMYL